MPEVKNLFDLINKSNNLLVLLSDIKTEKDIVNLSFLCSLFTTQNKRFEVVSVSKIEPKVSKMLHSKNIVVGEELRPTEYVLTIDYGSSEVEKIVYDTDKENGKLIFKILPSKGGFSFDKVEFEEGGGRFDGVICVNIPNPKNLGEIYDKNEYLFKENSYFQFENFDQVVSFLIRSTGQLSPDITQELLETQVELVNLIGGYAESENIADLFNLSSNGGDISKAISKKYYSKPDNFIDLYKNIFENVVRLADKKVTYSIINQDELVKLEIDQSFLKTIGKIPFNISSEYDLAFLFFEINEKELFVIIESNNIDLYSAQTIAGIYKGSGDKGHAICTLDITLSEIDKRFLVVLKDLYNIDISLKNKVPVVDNSNGKLTKSRKYSTNRGFKEKI